MPKKSLKNMREFLNSHKNQVPTRRRSSQRKASDPFKRPSKVKIIAEAINKDEPHMKGTFPRIPTRPLDLSLPTEKFGYEDRFGYNYFDYTTLSLTQLKKALVPVSKSFMMDVIMGAYSNIKPLPPTVDHVRDPDPHGKLKVYNKLKHISPEQVREYIKALNQKVEEYHEAVVYTKSLKMKMKFD
jgi:hypothetical protein